MTTYEQGAIVVLPFPFVGQRETKLRPALVLSVPHPEKRYPGDFVIAPITSQFTEPLRLGEIRLPANAGTGLKVPSVVRLDTVMTVQVEQISKQIGTAKRYWPDIVGEFKRVFLIP